MLTGMRISFVGGDARQLEVIRYVTQQDATAYMVGFDQCDLSFADAVKTELNADMLSAVDAVVLPIAGLSEDGAVNARYSSKPIQMTEEHFRALPDHCKVFTGIAGHYLETMCERHSLSLIRLMELDEVAILNSIPTAEGAVAMAMENIPITIHGSCAAVIGLGRCGLSLARLLHAMGATVRVAARRPADIARAVEMGLEPYGMIDVSTMIEDADIVFNTVPALVLTADVLAHASPECIIIDIASSPGGTDFRFAEKRGIKALLAPSLPGIVAPRTAGLIIAKTLYRLLRED